MAVAERLRDHLHPLLAAVRSDPSSEADFWARIALVRTPLIEPNPARPGYSIVTYVFAAPRNVGHVVVQPGFGEAADNVMVRIAGTSVCFASYSYRNDVRTSYSFAPDAPLTSFFDATEAEIMALLKYLRDFPPTADPHHREGFVSHAGEGRPDDVISFVSLSDAPDESIVNKRHGAQRGWIDQHVFESKLMGNQRRLWVYTPPGYQAGDEACPLLVVFDGGWALTRVPTHRLLDNLLADGRIRPTVAVFVDNATQDSRNTELPCNEAFAQFIEEELLPWVRSRYRVSEDPAEHFVTGASFGGLASMWLGYRLPHVFGNVISQAASLWWGPGFRMDAPNSVSDYTPEWLIEQYSQSPRLPVRFWVEIGLLERADRMIEPNRRMKAVLESKGYELTYSEPAGGHDTALWRGTLAKALEKMLPPTG